MARSKRKLQFGLRSLLVGVTAAGIAVAITTWLDFAGEAVIIVAAIAAVALEAMIHRRGLGWILRSRRRQRPARGGSEHRPSGKSGTVSR